MLNITYEQMFCTLLFVSVITGVTAWCFGYLYGWAKNWKPKRKPRKGGKK